MDFASLTISFLLGVIAGGILMEQTRRPNVTENSIGKIKKNVDPNVSQTLGAGDDYPVINFPEETKQRKKFLGIFKRKPKPL